MLSGVGQGCYFVQKGSGQHLMQPSSQRCKNTKAQTTAGHRPLLLFASAKDNPNLPLERKPSLLAAAACQNR